MPTVKPMSPVLGAEIAGVDATRLREGLVSEAVGLRTQLEADRARALKPLPHSSALLPVFIHLAIVLMLGLYIPPHLADWYRQAAKLLG